MTTQLFRPAFSSTISIGSASIASVLLVSLALLVAGAAAVADWRSQRVPDALVVLAGVPVVAAVVVADRPAHRLAAVAVGAVVMAIPLLGLHLAAPAAIGFGDVKLAAALGAALGVLAPALAVPALGAAAALTLAVAACTRRVAVPFAPGLVVGVGLALALGSLEAWKVAA